MNKRPLAVTILAWVYIAMGAVGVVYHLPELDANNALQFDGVWIELVRLLAVVAGVFMLRGQNWARWVAVAWIAFHVIIGALHSLQQFAIHCLFCAVIAFFLFRPDATRYFRGGRTEPS
jgi:hypothetical protein